MSSNWIQRGNRYTVFGGEASGEGTISGDSITLSYRTPDESGTAAGIIKNIGQGNVANLVEWEGGKGTWTRSPNQNLPPPPI